MGRQKIEDFIRSEFGVEGDRLWVRFPDYVVFRSKRNRKWFAVVMDVEKRRLGLDGEGKTDIINLKCDPILLGSLLQSRGFLPAYHMNKEKWVSILLDGSVPEKDVTDLISFSYALIDRK